MRNKGYIASAVVMTAVLAAGMSLCAFAQNLGNGQWRTGTGADYAKYKFVLNDSGSAFIKDGWQWIQDSDGQIRCYCFDSNGYVLTNTEADGYKLDADGHWVDANGTIMTGTDANDYYVHTASLADTVISQAAAPAVSQQTAGSAVGDSDDMSAWDGGDSVISGVVKAGKTLKSGKTTTTSKGKKMLIRGAFAGLSRNYAADMSSYIRSAVSGGNVSNSWANFSMNTGAIGGTAFTSGTNDSGEDFSILYGDAELVVRYLPLDTYIAGNTSLDSFIESFRNGMDGFKGSTRGADTTFGPYTFKTLDKAMRAPFSSWTDKTYLRVVNGTNYVQIISVTQCETGQDFVSVLNTMAAVN